MQHLREQASHVVKTCRSTDVRDQKQDREVIWEYNWQHVGRQRLLMASRPGIPGLIETGHKE